MEDNSSRRKFIQQSALLGAGIMVARSAQLLAGDTKFKSEKNRMKKKKTWKSGSF